MQYAFGNGFYKIARTAGSSYNFLAICLAETEQDIEIEPLPLKEGQAERLSAHHVLPQIKAGLIRACKELGRDYFIAKAQFIPSDSFSSSVYEDLTIELISRIDRERIQAGRDF